MIYYGFIALQIIFLLLYRNSYSLLFDNKVDVSIKDKPIIHILSFIYLFFISGFRDYTVGYDTGQYARRFWIVSNTQWSDLFKQYDFMREPGFYLVCKAISVFTNNDRWLFIISGLFFAFSICYFISKKSRNSPLSYLMLFPLQYYSFLLSGMRQGFAIAIILISYTIYDEKKKKIIPIIGCILAVLFHLSSVFVVPLFFVNNKKISNTKRFLFLISLPLFYAFGNKLIIILQKFIYGDYVLYESKAEALATFLVYIGIWSVYVVFLNRRNIEMDSNNTLEKIMMLGMIIQVLVPNNPNLYRLALYYQIFTVISVPYLLSFQSNNNKRVMTTVFIILMIIMFSRFTFYSCGINPFSLYM